ncbi:hypothetical protein EB796_009211 [Bugula neritina]|uniref:SMP-30/Gluconolactonase/LRE-like region domain-containing protein n=1 Tax=Bugula neritina TaxID=10212 RepID=A0A7J7K3C8_BUGNE|nr:hypothetical protein EB796_009211 [Bugula neritina]
MLNQAKAYPYGFYGKGAKCVAQFGQQGFRGDDLFWPWYCDISNSGDIAIADTDNNRIQVFQSSQNTSIFPPYGGLGVKEGDLKSPRSVKYSPIPGTSFAVADTGNKRISMLRINYKLGQIEHVFSFGQTIFVEPSDVAVDRRNGNIVVADSGLNKVLINNQYGECIGELEQRGFQFCRPSAVTVTHDGKSDIYVSDSGNHCIRKFTCNGDYVGALGRLGAEEGEFNTPRGIALDRQGYVYVADEFNNRVQMFTPDLAHVTTVVSSVPRPKGVAVGQQLLVTSGDQSSFAKVFQS